MKSTAIENDKKKLEKDNKKLVKDKKERNTKFTKMENQNKALKIKYYKLVKGGCVKPKE